MNNESTAASYNQQPYRTFANRDSSPQRLAALARLTGIDAAAPDRCAVLEIGCGTGGNIIPWAERYPDATFVGIDISSQHIETCNTIQNELSLANCQFHCVDIADFQVEAASYDYVICHGVFSWVQEPVQERIFEVVARALRPNGVAYTSYNTLPGWRQRGALRDIVSFGAGLSAGSDPMSRLGAGVRLLKMIGDNRSSEGDLYGSYLREAVRRFEHSEPAYLYHEYLEPCNNPLLFVEFVTRAAKHGMMFVCEAKPAMHLYDDLDQEAKDFLNGFGPNVIGREQALDLFRNRMFRESVLCLSDKGLRRDLKASVFRDLWFSTEWRELSGTHAGEGAEGASGETAAAGSRERTFRDVGSGRELRFSRGIIPDLLALVAGCGACGASFSDIDARFAREYPSVHDATTVVRALGMLVQGGFVEVTCLPTFIEGSPEGIGLATGYARRQAGEGGAVTSLRHQSYTLTPFERRILCASTGSESLRVICERVRASASGEKLSPEDAQRSLGRLIDLGFFIRHAA